MKVVVIGGGRACGKTTLLNQLNIACQGMDVQFVETGDAGDIALEMARLVGGTLEDKAIRLSRIAALEEQLAAAPPDIYLHMHTAPSRQNQRLRTRRGPGDEYWRHADLWNLDLYQRAVIPQLCQKHNTFYFPVTFDRGVSLSDFLPELLNVLK
uniref:Deoxynucleoside kinase n=1 Tax=Pseudomonas phage Ulitu01 TaxID=3138550 RepID=A0AAU6W143_9CAUD